MSHIHPTPPSAVYNVKSYGASGDGSNDDTTAIQAALDAAGASPGSVVLVPQSANPYMFSNIKIPAYTRLAGEHMLRCQLKRIVGSTGAAIREKTAAEGNTYGATGIWIEDLFIDGNSTAGDGIDIGRQNVTYPFASAGSIQNVLVSGFTSGTGFIIQSNAQSFYYLWAGSCQTGFNITGGSANAFHSLWSENNSGNQIIINESYDNFYGIQIEDSSTSPSLVVNSGSNSFTGIYVALGGAKTTVIQNTAGANKNAYRDITVAANGHAYTNTLLFAGTGLSTGAVSTVHEFLIGENADASSWYVNASTGAWNKFLGDISQFAAGIAVATKAGAPVDGDYASPVNGLLVIDTTNNKIYVRIGGVWKSVTVA